MRLFARLSETKMMFITHSSNFVSKTNIPANKPVAALLQEDLDLMPVLQRLKANSNWQQIYVDAAPESLKNSSRVTRIEGTTLVIGVPNGAIATKLKLLIPDLLDDFAKNRKQEQEVTAIRVEVQPGLFLPAAPTSPAAPRQPIPLDRLEALSQQLSDSPLKNKVDTLRRRHQRKVRSKT